MIRKGEIGFLFLGSLPFRKTATHLSTCSSDRLPFPELSELRFPKSDREERTLPAETDRSGRTLPAETDRLLADSERLLDEVVDSGPSDNWGWTFSLSSLMRLDTIVSFLRLDKEVSFCWLDKVSFSRLDKVSFLRLDKEGSLVDE